MKSPILHYLVKGQEIEVSLKPIAEAHILVPVGAAIPMLVGTLHVDPEHISIEMSEPRIRRQQRDPPISAGQLHNAAFSSHWAVASVHSGQARCASLSASCQEAHDTWWPFKRFHVGGRSGRSQQATCGYCSSRIINGLPDQL